MFLFFPQWQGAGRRTRLPHGAHAMLGLLRTLEPSASVLEVAVSDNIGATEHGINGYAEVRAQLEQAANLLQRQQPTRVFTIGGDCSVAMAPIAHLNTRHDNLAVVWFDAHADINSPKSSQSHNLHGMPVRFVLGKGEENMQTVLPSVLRPDQIHFVGTRDLDAPEKDFLEAHQMRLTRVAALEENPEILVETFAKNLANQRVYIHLDLDILDPSIFAALETPHAYGVSFEVLRHALSALCQRCEVVGWSITAYAPHHTGENLEKVAVIFKTLLHKENP